MRTRDQSSIFSTGGKFRPDYGLLLELHTLTLVACSYALLLQSMALFSLQQKQTLHFVPHGFDNSCCAPLSPLCCNFYLTDVQCRYIVWIVIMSKSTY